MKRTLAALFMALLVCALAVTGMAETYDKQAIMDAYNNRDNSSATVTWSYAENQPIDYPTTIGAYYLSNYLFEKSEGRINLEVYYGAQLGDETSVLEQMQYGGVSMARTSMSPLCEFVPAMNVLQMPYLYNNGEHMWKVLSGEIGQSFLDQVEEATELKGLTYYDAGSRNFYATKPLNSMADLKGLTIRVQESSLMQDMMKAIGANSQAMAFAEVYSALQTGVVDGAENNMPSYYATAHYEVAKNFICDEHTRVPEVVTMSKVIWNKLSAEDQALVVEAAKAATECEKAVWAAYETECRAMVEAAGSTIVELDAAGMKEFQDAVAGLYDKYCADYTDIVEAIRALGE